MRYFGQRKILMSLLVLLSMGGVLSGSITLDTHGGHGYGYFLFYSPGEYCNDSGFVPLNWDQETLGGFSDAGPTIDIQFESGEFHGEPLSYQPAGFLLLGGYDIGTPSDSYGFGCYRDPIFDDGRMVPNEPASVGGNSGQVEITMAIPEPTMMVMLACGAVMLIQRRRGAAREQGIR